MPDNTPLRDDRIQLAWPVLPPNISQYFADNPDFYKQFRMPGHDGLDFKVNEGDPVFAASAGVISQVKDVDKDPSGLQIKIQHEMDGADFETSYGHLSDIHVQEGQTVQAQQIIAKAGQSGNATGPVLHFGLKVKGMGTPGYPDGVVDPLPYFPGTGSKESDNLVTGEVDSEVDTVVKSTEGGLAEDRAALLQQLRDSNADRRKKAVLALADRAVDDEEVRQALTESLEDRSKFVRLAVVRALQDAVVRHKNVRSGIMSRLDDIEGEVRLAAVNALKDQIPDEPDLPGRFIELLDDPNPDVNRAVVEALRPLQDGSAEVKTALQSWSDKSQVIKFSALASQVEEGAIDTNTTSDQPVQHIEQDRFGFRDYVEALNQFIRSEDTQPPLVIGIDGSWGSGKSSLMGMLKNELERPADDKLELSRWKADYRRSLLRWTWGRFLLWLYRDRNDDRLPERVRFIRYGLAFDPRQHDLENDTRDWSDEERYWVRVAYMHKPHLDSTPMTVWFNAWKYGQEEQLWAALALDVLNQLNKRSTPWGRFVSWMRLTINRTSGLGLAWEIFKRILIPILLIALYLIYEQYLAGCEGQTSNTCKTLQGFAQEKSWLLLGGALVSGYLSVSKILRDPFQINLKAVLDRPDYKTRIGFLGEFEQDFARIIEIATRPAHGRLPRKLVIFIDDLDRCEPPKAADIVSAINIMLDSARSIFVLGMDLRAVLPSITKKYKDIFDHIRQQDPEIGDPARTFLEKIIQIPLRVPRPDPGKIQDYISELVARKITALQRAPEIKPPPRVSQTGQGDLEATSPRSGGRLETTRAEKDSAIEENIDAQKKGVRTPSPPAIDPLRYNREQIQDAVEKGALYIGDNPRLAKRYVNLFRLFVYLAIQRGVLRMELGMTDGKAAGGDEAENRRELTPENLAVWLAWSMRWYEVVECLQDEGQVDDLRRHLGEIALLDPKAKDYEKKREAILRSVIEAREADFHSRWNQLKWEIWLQDKDFSESVRELGPIWSLPETGRGDWLETLLNMSAATRIPEQEI